MAHFNFDFNENAFVVEPAGEVSTDCATIYSYNVIAKTGENIRVTLSGSSENATYILDGTEFPLTSPQTVQFNIASLVVRFSLQNSGSPGIFSSGTVLIENLTTTESYNSYSKTVTRSNDNAKCDSGKLKYDDLEDTPATKIGNEGKYIKVSLDGLSHEYVDSVPGDAQYVHTQATASITWTIPHLLGKFPSIRIKDGSGNTVHGDVNDVDSSNMTVTFNTAFSGVAYLN
jgi:hypothetical protein